jgi:signal recognition particle subunit SRP54
MFENLSDKLEGAFKSLKGQGRISDINIAQTVKEVRRALVDADVNFKVAKELTDRIKKEAIGQKVINSVSPGQLLVKITSDELTKLMGESEAKLDLSADPSVILMSGLQGSGKTTFSGKLAKHLMKMGKSVLLVAADVYRPAAIEQLKVIGESVGAEVFSVEGLKDPLKISEVGIKHAKANKKKVVIIDTAGRLAVDDEMMNEIESIKRSVNPSETLFVVDAMTGQDAVNTAKTFNERIDFDGVILTKLDGDTRGGAAISIRAVVNKPIKFIGTGEKIEGIDVFYPDRMAQRILGMGDVVSLVERAQQAFDEDEAKMLNKKLRQNTFDFNDFKSQIKQVKKMGNIKDLMGMVPGMGKMVKNVDLDNESFGPILAMIDSMTPGEREKPDLIDGGRRKRIATGSGNSIQEVNKLIKQFSQMRSVMKKFNNQGKGKRGTGINPLLN